MWKYDWIYKDSKTQYAHRVIMEEHLGRKLKSTETVHHRDSNRLNNRISNLEITSRSENAMRFHRERREAKDCHRPGAKLLKEDVPTIRKMLRDKISLRLIGLAYGVHLATISDIKRQLTWNWV